MPTRREVKGKVKSRTRWAELARGEVHSVPNFSIIPPDQNLIAITRLYLEKYEILADEDRALYRRIIALIACPAIIMKGTE